MEGLALLPILALTKPSIELLTETIDLNVHSIACYDA
jgi:hypothetical protein